MTIDELPEEKRTRCEVWTRVMGYHRPVSGFNDGKKAEQKERKYFVEAKIEPSLSILDCTVIT